MDLATDYSRPEMLDFPDPNEPINVWLKMCDGILDLTRKGAFLRIPSENAFNQIRTGIRESIKFGQTLLILLSDPELGDLKKTAEIKIRLDQLNEIWLALFDKSRMSEVEANQFLSEVFP